jgi:diguanylate cyclase (GGDEF)-like protein
MAGASSPGEVTVDGDGGAPPEPPVPPVPPDVAARIVRAIDRSPSTVVTLIDRDLNIRWISHSATWVTGTDPGSRQGASSLERIHPDDVDRLIHGLAQLRAAGPAGEGPGGVPQPIRYRFQRFDGRWVVMEATIHNLLGDPVVEGMLVFARPVDGELDGVGYVLDLLVADQPLPDVLAACAGLVPDFLGSAAVVALLPDGAVVGARPGTPAAQLAGDARWWQCAARGEVLSPVDFTGFPDDLAAQARAEGFRSAWSLPIRDQPTGAVIGCVIVWVHITVERNIVHDEALRQTERLASLVIAEERRRDDLRRQAVTDPLTGLANRSALERRLGEVDGLVTVAILDLDDFKPVNDTHGHDTGDAVLRVVAERLRAGVREGDLAVRYGGDEFAIVFAAGTYHDDAVRSAERVVQAIQAPVALDGRLSVSVGASVGVATAPAEKVAHLADAALYDAKRAKQDAAPAAPPAGGPAAPRAD